MSNNNNNGNFNTNVPMSNNSYNGNYSMSIPIGTVEAHRIVAIHKENRDIVAYKLENGTVIDEVQAVQMCEAGQLPDYRVGVSRAGTLFIRNVSDGDPSNNLDNLPIF